jgi:RHS repeat-associated protein
LSADWLNAPHIIQNASKENVWTWDHYAFGDNAPNQNPAGFGTFVYNPRFQGQYKDVETNLNYNHFRDYNPTLGRYVESDPLGLAGGINTFQYVKDNPLKFTDRRGLDTDYPPLARHSDNPPGSPILSPSNSSSTFYNWCSSTPYCSSFFGPIGRFEKNVINSAPQYASRSCQAIGNFAINNLISMGQLGEVSVDEILAIWQATEGMLSYETLTSKYNINTPTASRPATINGVPSTPDPTQK